MPEELEPFDAREYLTAGDWQSVLVHRGWHPAPENIESARKNYVSPLGWTVDVWVEHEAGLAVDPEDNLIVAFGPNGHRLAGTWVTGDEVLGTVNRLEQLIQLDQPYDVVSRNVAKFLGAIPRANESEEDFDARAYLTDDFDGLMQSLGYVSTGGRSYAKRINTPLVDFRIYWSGLTEDSPVQVGHVLVEARPAENRARLNSNFFSHLSYTFDGDPPLDVIKELDTCLDGWTNTFEAAEGELTRFRSKLIELSDRRFKAKKRVESIVNKLLGD